MNNKKKSLILTTCMICSRLICAEGTPVQEEIDTLKTVNLQGTVINGQRNSILFSGIPGSVSTINNIELRRTQPITGNEIIRKIPGIHALDEEGLGMRANFGIRGLDPSRSTKVLILEDGIPVSLNPYGEPELYYSPSIDRMAGVEVLKGSGQIMFGPQTIGGVINYITPDVPKERQINVGLRGGMGQYMAGNFSYGETINNVGFLVSYNRKSVENLGNLKLESNDLNIKFRFELNEKSYIIARGGYYTELSNATYVGLTQNMYESGLYDQILSPDDRFAVNRLSGSVSHHYQFKPGMKLKTTLFAYTTSRNWQRQNFTYSSTANNQSGVIWGDSNITGGAIYMLDANTHNDRTFSVRGAETNLDWVIKSKNGFINRINTGVRVMHEQAFDQSINGTKADARSGNINNQDERSGTAFSAYAQDRIYFNKRFSLSLGARTEFYEFGREIYRRAGIDTFIQSRSQMFAFIPGAGLSYDVDEKLTVFSGIHRGFAAPRIKDAIANTGEVYQLDAELSWNSELGIRMNLSDFISMEATAFNMDFSNQIIPVSEAAGGAGSGQINGGATIHRGIELGFNIKLDKKFHSKLLASIDGSVTKVQSEYSADRFKNNGTEIVNIKGNRTPYSPDMLMNGGVNLGIEKGPILRLSSTYIGKQYTDELNSELPSANGRSGAIDPFMIFDASLIHELKKSGLLISVSCKNLTDNRTIVNRRPQGIRTHIPRMLTMGLNWTIK
jgi:Fe(3+) dicitrate transport protein